jgi:hypothetical protein
VRRRAPRRRLVLVAALALAGGPASGEPGAEAAAAAAPESPAREAAALAAAAPESPAPEAATPEPDPPEPAAPDASEIALRAAGALRAPQSYLEATLSVKRSGLSRPREIAFRRYDDRRSDRTLVRIVSPEKHAGAVFLKLPPNLWVFSPADGAKRRLPWAELGEPWMKSAFLHDDLLHGSDAVRDYEHRLVRIDASAGERGDRRAFVLESTPRPGSPAAWGRILAWIDAEDATPLRQEFYDGEGGLVRTLEFADLREVEGRRFPHLWIARPADGEGREARIRVDAVRVGAAFDEAILSTRSLGPPEAAAPASSPAAGSQ